MTIESVVAWVRRARADLAQIDRASIPERRDTTYAPRLVYQHAVSSLDCLARQLEEMRAAPALIGPFEGETAFARRKRRS